MAKELFWKGQIGQRTIKWLILAKEQLKWFILANELLENTKITLETHIFKNCFNYVPRVILVFSSSWLAKMSHFYCSLVRMNPFIFIWPIWPFQNCLLARMIFNPTIYHLKRQVKFVLKPMCTLQLNYIQQMQSHRRLFIIS